MGRCRSILTAHGLLEELLLDKKGLARGGTPWSTAFPDCRNAWSNDTVKAEGAEAGLGRQVGVIDDLVSGIPFGGVVSQHLADDRMMDLLQRLDLLENAQAIL